MAIGFIKKMFSFGKKEAELVEEQVDDRVVAEDAEAVEEPAAAPAPDPTEEDVAPAPVVSEPEQNIEEEPQAGAPEAIIEAIAPQAEEPVAEAAPEPQPEPTPLPAPTPVAPAAPPAPAATKPLKVQVSKAVAVKQDLPEPVAEPEKKLSWYERLRQGLARSSSNLSDSIGGIFTKRKLDDDTLQELEDVLIQADLGLETAMRVTDALSASRYGKDVSTDEVRAIMGAEIEKVLTPVAKPLELDLSHKPHVILVVGVNGTGKTTTIGKLAAKLTAGGLKVMLAAGDTFRAAAIEQLHIWGERTGSPVVSSKLGADAAGLAYDAWEKAKEAGSDVLIIDTAGRLQNKAELMDELAKIVRVLSKHDAEAPHTVLQTLDATTGQNALNQVEIFKNIAGVNGLVMTKLDGSARGGILVSISAKHKLPVYFIGVGEGIDDLEPFAAKDFAKAIAGVAS
ncbi:fused signal recognition particle receptor [Paenochrobactrum gallinarii]|uniref:Signal recognition particle receptor FtsY n=1 Tax=Paenochrobactrum gallinarii TaxID=643673 RepID=A0A841LRX0_9HYPH|nr:signal recognition particle-docking protein FtsY [Paenochrobactrum gallinarii]MBB6260833.1 fused signal recognition particle receptor [Paenochrobactrum gallinarii]